MGRAPLWLEIFGSAYIEEPGLREFLPASPALAPKQLTMPHSHIVSLWRELGEDKVGGIRQEKGSDSS